jgi:hypothetical protein
MVLGWGPKMGVRTWTTGSMWCPCETLGYSAHRTVWDKKRLCSGILPYFKTGDLLRRAGAVIFGPWLVMALNLGHVGGVNREVALT